MKKTFLGIETSGKDTGLALISNDKIIYQITEKTQAQHNENIYNLLEEILTKTKLEIRQLSGIGVAIGPGMFTSLRVGISLAKGLAEPFSIQVKGVNTIDALADSITDQNRLIIPIIDARKGELFTAFYRSGKRISDYQIISPQELAKLINEPAVFLGNGLERYASLLKEILGEKFISEPIFAPPASRIAFIAQNEILKGNADDLLLLEPFYLRPADAEVNIKNQK